MFPEAPKHALAWLVVAVAIATSPAALARQSDRNQPMDIEAGKQQGSLDDNTPTVLSGGVTIEQGTLRAEASRAEITTRGGNISRVVLTGSPAKLSQQMDDGTPMSAIASNIDYNVTSEVVVFTGGVNITQPRGTLSGERVVYNMTSGEVTSGGEGAGRVKMRIMPRNTGAPATPSEPVTTPEADADAPAEGG